MRLNNAYREAWKQLSWQIGLWQSLVSDPAAKADAVNAACAELKQAECIYRFRRNLLAEYLLTGSTAIVEDDCESARLRPELASC